MTYNRKFLFGLLVLGFLLSCRQTPQQRAENGTVLIVVGNTDSNVGFGSGFFVERDKIATNIHLVDSGMVFAIGRKTVYNIEAVTGYNIDRDLVILKVSGKGIPLELSEGQIGEPISVVGYPGGGYDITEGTIHGIRGSDNQLRLVPNGFPNKSKDPVSVPGNSGGPVLNSEWKVIGIAVSGGEDFSYAIAPSVLNALLNSSNKEKLSDWQRKDPIRASVYAARGDEKLKSEDYKLAIEGLNKAIELYRGARAYNARGQAKGSLNQYQEAIQDFDEAIHRIPDDPTFYYHRGITKLKWGHYKDAILDFDETLELNPDHLEADRNRDIAKVRKSDPDYEGAIQDYNKAINRNPKDPAYYKIQGDAKQESGDYEEAIQDYNKAIELKKDYAGAYYNRGNAKKAIGKARDAKLDHAKAYYYWGKTNSNRGNYQEAIKKFDKSIDFNPDYVTYYDRGAAKQERKDYEGAIQDFKKAIEQKPDDAAAYNYLGTTHAHRGNYKVAHDYFKKAINQNPKLVEAHYNLGKALYYLDDYKAAIDQFNKTIELKTTFAKAYEYRGKAKEALGKHEDAKQDFVKAANVYNGRGIAKTELGKTKADIGDLKGAYNLYQEAIADHDTAIRLEPVNARFYENRGVTRLRHGAVRNHNDHNGRIEDYKAAIEDCTKAIKRKLDFANAYYWRGQARCLLGYTKANQERSKEARELYKKALNEDFKKAINLNPDKALYYEGLGLANAALGKAKATIEAFKEAKKKKLETKRGKQAN